MRGLRGKTVEASLSYSKFSLILKLVSSFDWGIFFFSKPEFFKG
jgi:hypothetical protein